MELKKQFCYLLLLLGGMFSGTAQQTKNDVEQLKEVVITATKFPVKKELSGKIIYKIDSVDISHAKSMTVLEVIDKLTSIHIHDSNSAAGKNKGIYIRGGRDRQVIILVDGIAVNDPSGIHTTYDLRLLDINQVASIEIMNGTASTLYGSGAATGVINIVMKSPQASRLNGNLALTFGTNNNQHNKNTDLNSTGQSISVNGSLGKLSYLAGISNQWTDGLSEARSPDDLPFSSDEWKALNSHVKLRFKPAEQWMMQAYFNFDKNTFDFDGGAFTDSGENNSETVQRRLGFVAKHSYNKGDLTFMASQSSINRSFNSFNAWSNAMDHYEYEGISLVLEALNTIQLNHNLKLVAGLNYQRLQNNTKTPFGNIDESLANYNTFDPYLHLTITLPAGFNMNVGGRMSTHSTYGSHWVYNINPSYNLNNNWRVLTSFSTAFIAPSTYQLFSQYGNTSLEPEKDKSFEFGLEYQTAEALTFSVVYFDRSEENSIQLPDFVKYTNLEEQLDVAGFEFGMKMKMLKHEGLRFAYSYINKDADLDYIPKNKINVNLESYRIKNSYVALNFKYISKRTYFDQWASGTVIDLPSYKLMDLYVSHNFSGKKITAFMNLQNLWNEDYEETLGFSTRGRTVSLGLNYAF